MKKKNAEKKKTLSDTEQEILRRRVKGTEKPRGKRLEGGDLRSK